MNIRDYTPEQLRRLADEMEREQLVSERPPVQEEINWERVIDLADTFINENEEGESGEDTQHYIFEEVMKAVYTDKIWNYLKKL